MTPPVPPLPVTSELLDEQAPTRALMPTKADQSANLLDLVFMAAAAPESSRGCRAMASIAGF